MGASTDTTVNIMAFEGGVLIDCLSSKAQGQAFADRIEKADREAIDASKVNFDLAMDPIEVGMAISALEMSNSSLAHSLAEKVEAALTAKLQELNIEYGPEQPESGGLGQGGLSSQSQGLLGDGQEPAEGSDEGAEPSDTAPAANG